jgi:hypothetical protein
MNLGADRKKLGILGALLVVAALIFWINSSGNDAPPAAQRQKQAERSAAPAMGAAPQRNAPAPAVISQAPRTVRQPGRGGQEFRPSMKPKRPEDRADPMTVDPTLRLDLLAKLHDVKLEGGTRSLFDFGQAAPPKTADVKIIPKAVKNADGKTPQLAVNPAAPATTPSKPPPPAIPLKFYGYANQTKPGIKRAFFIEGEEIFVAAEGELIKKRYKIVRIGVTSAVVEDTQFQHQQTLPLEEQPA